MSYKSSYTGAQIDAALAKANTSLQDSGDQTITGGNLVIGTSGKGIDFSASTDTSTGTVTNEILTDYEEGTWEPSYTTDGTEFSTLTYSTRLGKYTRIGRLVFVSFQIVVNTVSGGSGNLYLTSLPFTPGASGCAGHVALALGWSNPCVTLSTDQNATKVGIMKTLVNNQCSYSDITNGCYFYGSLTYTI